MTTDHEHDVEIDPEEYLGMEPPLNIPADPLAAARLALMRKYGFEAAVNPAFDAIAQEIVAAFRLEPDRGMAGVNRLDDERNQLFAGVAVTTEAPSEDVAARLLRNMNCHQGACSTLITRRTVKGRTALALNDRYVEAHLNRQIVDQCSKLRPAGDIGAAADPFRDGHIAGKRSPDRGIGEIEFRASQVEFRLGEARGNSQHPVTVRLPFCTASVLMMRATSWFQRMTMSRDSPLGPHMPYQCTTSKPGSVSLIEATSGMRSERLVVVIPMGRKRPALTCGSVGTRLMHVKCASPATAAVSAGPPPLYGT